MPGLCLLDAITSPAGLNDPSFPAECYEGDIKLQGDITGQRGFSQCLKAQVAASSLLHAWRL